MSAFPWYDPNLSDTERKLAEAEFAVSRGYRVEHYSAEIERLIAALESESPAPEAGPHTDLSGLEEGS